MDFVCRVCISDDELPSCNAETSLLDCDLVNYDWKLSKSERNALSDLAPVSLIDSLIRGGSNILSASHGRDGRVCILFLAIPYKAKATAGTSIAVT